jgi:two-component system OmpR family sensor kinase
MLTEGWASDEAKRKEYHERILRESQRLELLIDRVMQKSRLETSGSKPIPTNLQALVEEIVDSQSDMKEDISLKKSSPPPNALTDPEGVRSILENLIENARKYAYCSSKSPVEVYVGSQNGQPMLTVSDRGPGISSEDRALIFDAFYRSGNEERRSAKGVGLGLHLASLHANAMGAEIAVNERSGGGAVFTVLFERASP